MSNFKDVQELHFEKFGITPNSKVITHEEALVRADFIGEELIELRNAIDNNVPLDEIDALIDIAYVAMGTAALMGINWENHWDTVHNANMQKVPGFNPTRPDMPRDLRKPNGWNAPDHYTELNRKPKIMVIGHGRHGKDTVCDILQAQYNLSFTSSSYVASNHIIYPVLKDKYNSPVDCFNDRHNHRALWHDLINAYTNKDKAKLGRIIYNDYDIYCGVRSASELWAINKAKLYDLCIWVDAMERCEPEDSSSITVTEHMADVIIDNNGPQENLLPQIRKIMEHYNYG